jgi:hypothetical protein
MSTPLVYAGAALALGIGPVAAACYGFGFGFGRSVPALVGIFIPLGRMMSPADAAFRIGSGFGNTRRWLGSTAAGAIILFGGFVLLASL